MLIDGENYFRAVRHAMMRAEERIVMMGWDFDTRIKMYDTQGEIEGPLALGDFIEWLVARNPDLHIYIIRWNMGIFKSLFRRANLRRLVKWMLHRRIHLKLDGKHPVGAAQHQKVIAIDRDTAFCGGLDITNQRWDTRGHPAVEERRAQPDGIDFGPWHDVAMIVQGPVAGALADFAERRWRQIARRKMIAVRRSCDCWPPDLEAQFRDVSLGIARTKPELPDQRPVYEIEQLYLDIIASAETYIYAESQYLASRKIAAAIAARLREEDGPEVVIVNPVTAQGWLEPMTMDSSRAQIVAALRNCDRHDRFRLYHVFNEGGEDVYIHAKLLIADDRILRVGSSNFNNRSLGFDTECDVVLAAENGDVALCRNIRSIRNDLLAEHLGMAAAGFAALVEREGSLIAAIEAGRAGADRVRAYEFPELNGIEEWMGEKDILDPKDADDNFAMYKLA